MSDNYVYVKVKLNLKDFQTEDSIEKILSEMESYFNHEEIIDHEIGDIHDMQIDNKKSKVVMFSRPVAIEDLTYEVRVPNGLTEKEEVEWIMSNKSRIKCISSYSERYTLDEYGDPNDWTEWEVTIDPSLNTVEEDSFEE